MVGADLEIGVAKRNDPSPSSGLGSLLPTAGATGSGGADLTLKYCHSFPIFLFLCNLLDRQKAGLQIGVGHCQSRMIFAIGLPGF